MNLIFAMQNTFTLKWNFLIFGLHWTKIPSLKRAITQHEKWRLRHRSMIGYFLFCSSSVAKRVQSNNARTKIEFHPTHWLSFVFKVKITWNPIRSFTNTAPIFIENYILDTFLVCFFIDDRNFFRNQKAHIFLRCNPFYYEPVNFPYVCYNEVGKKGYCMHSSAYIFLIVYSWTVDAERWSKKQIVYNSIVMHLLYRVIKIQAICAILKYDPCNELPMHLMYDHRRKCKCSQAKYTNKFIWTRKKFITFCSDLYHSSSEEIHNEVSWEVLCSKTV